MSRNGRGVVIGVAALVTAALTAGALWWQWFSRKRRPANDPGRQGRGGIHCGCGLCQCSAVDECGAAYCGNRAQPDVKCIKTLPNDAPSELPSKIATEPYDPLPEF